MPCCGQHRNPPRDTFTRRAQEPAFRSKPEATASGAGAGRVAMGGAVVRLRYMETSPVMVRGAVSGRYYSFSGAQPDQVVSAEDAPQLLRTSFFRAV